VTRGITAQVIKGTVSAVVIPSLTAVNRILRLEPLPTWTRGTVALLGDAAQAMEPNLGQGAAQESQVRPLPSAPDSRRARIRSQIRTSCFTSRSLSPSNISSWIVEE
jgi:hypothetical protein